MGTIFYIEAYQEEALIEATLVKGLLSIEQFEDKKGAIILKPIEKISIGKEGSGTLREDYGPPSDEMIGSVELQGIPIRDIQVEKRIEPYTEIFWKDQEWIIRGHPWRSYL